MAAGDISSWISSHADILRNIANNLGPVQHLITGTAYLIGVGLAFKGLYVLKTHGESRGMGSSQSGMKEPVLYFIVAAMLIYFPSGLRVMLMTTFGSNSIMEYAPVNSSNQTINSLFGPGSSAGRPLAMIIQTIGLFAFIKGWVLIARTGSQGQQPGGIGKGLMHVLGGILAINIVATINIINNTIYGT